MLEYDPKKARQEYPVCGSNNHLIFLRILNKMFKRVNQLFFFTSLS